MIHTFTSPSAAGVQTARHTSPPKEKKATNKSRAPPATVSARSTRAEVAVRHIAAQPSFLAWRATSTTPKPADVSSTPPKYVAQYLEERVAEVAAQLHSLQLAGDYARLVVLLSELLHGEMTVGATSQMILAGVLELMRAAATAVAHGEVSTYAVASAAAASTEYYSQQIASPSAVHTGNGDAGTTFQATQQSLYGSTPNAPAMPIESLLPPLIEQTVRAPRPAWDGTAVGGAASAEEEAEAEMEAWENYMATARVATTTDAALPQKSSAGALTTAAAAAAAKAAPLPPPQPAYAAADRDRATPLLCHAINSLPAALCALITSCTAAPLLCLTLQDQQCEKAAVAGLAQTLLDIIKELHNTVKEGEAVRLSALKGLHQLLRTYVAGGTLNETVTRSTRAAKAATTAPSAATAATATVSFLDSTQSATMLCDVTEQWALVLAAVQETEQHNNRCEAGEKQGESGDDGDNDANDKINEAEERNAFGANAATTGDGPVGELCWVMEIAYQLLQAQQQQQQQRGKQQGQPLHLLDASFVSPHTLRLLPPSLLPVTLRTLSLLPAFSLPPLAARAAMHARLCVDVLWTAASLAPVAAARQLLYGAIPAVLRAKDGTSTSRSSSTGESTHEDADCPAVDFFLALLHQFNQTHSAVNREMRDDLVCLLALLLRYDVQFAEHELVARRAAADAPPPPPAAASEDAWQDDTDVRGGECDTHCTIEALSACTPLSLSVSTVEAINAIVALLFETTCGAELTASTTGSSRSGAGVLVDADESRPSALLSQEAVRSYALRFQSVAISAARRRELVEFKKYGWQLLEVHFSWQLVHLTYREYTNYHDRAAAASLPPSAVARGRAGAAEQPGSPSQQHHHQRSSPIPQVTGEAPPDEAVTAALWGMQLCRLGYFDVLLSYVDVDSTVPAVVTWTREELVVLEEEAWQLFTSMILFTQHLDGAAGGIRVRRHRRYGPSNASQRGWGNAHNSNSISNAAVSTSGRSFNHSPSGELADDGDTFEDEDDAAGVLYGADMHFIAAGGVEVALRFLQAAPPELEAVKRSALVTLAAIARTSSSGEAHLHSGSYTSKELALVHRALTEHAPVLVPFLVKMIREVDAHVDAAGMPATAPALISTAALLRAPDADAERDGYDRDDADGDDGVYGTVPMVARASTTAPHTVARWGWLPQSAYFTVVFAWCLLRCIGDVVLTEVGMMRELPDLTMVGENTDADADADDGESGAASSVSSRAHTEKNFTAGAVRHSHADAVADNDVMGNVGDEALFEQAIEMSVHDDDNASSSGSSMGPPPDYEEDEMKARASARGAVQAAPHGKPSPSSPNNGTSGTAEMLPHCASMENTATRRHTLLRSMHEEVLLIPELFAMEGGVDLLTTWIRHNLSLCLSARSTTGASGQQQQQQQQQQQSQRAYRSQPHHHHQRTSLLRLTAEEVSELDRYSDLFLLLLDVFRAIVLGSEGNEAQFVRSGGVHGLLDLIEAFALAHGLMERAAHHARLLAAADPDAYLAYTTSLSNTPASTTTTATKTDASEQKEKKGVLLYAMTLLSDLLDNCPYALDEFATWHSSHIVTSPLTPDVLECSSDTSGIEAVQLLLCLWAADLPARNSSTSSINAYVAGSFSGLELLRLHLRPALRMALKEEYVCLLLRRRAKMGALRAETIRGYYRYIHADAMTGEGQTADVADAVVLAYMERLMTQHRCRNAVAAEQQIALLVNATLGLCLKVYGCLAAVGFDSLHAAETETAASPSLHVNLSSLERTFLVQVAALPALCVDEISTAMAEVALENQQVETPMMGTAGAGEKHDVMEDDNNNESDDVAAWRPTTPDRRALGTAAAEAAVRAAELDQIIEVGAQVQQARGTQLYHRYLVTQLRQPVAPPADGRPGAVKGAWKTQRRLTTTIGGRSSTTADAAAERPGEFAVELAARLSTRLAAEEHEHQQRMATVVLSKTLTAAQSAGKKKSEVGNAKEEEEGEQSGDSARLTQTAPPVLGSARTPYASLMNSVNAAAAERHSVSSFQVTAPPRRPAAPLTERHQKRQAMIARSLRKSPQDAPLVKNVRKA